MPRRARTNVSDDWDSRSVTPSTTSKKRKLSESRDTPATNGHAEYNTQGTQKTPLKKSTKPREEAAIDATTFIIECPAQAARSAQSDLTDDIYRSRDNPGIDSLDIDYTITPGSIWTSIRAYRNVKLFQQVFTTGQIIYVNRKVPAPPPPPADAPEHELLKYDKKNLWLARIAQAKAESGNSVLLRVCWLYWPGELPMGRQPYHGARELVMSNAMDIIDAQSIACAAEVSYWDECDDEQDLYQKERFWRQTFDVSQLHAGGSKSSRGLSSLRKHCICKQPYNPDTTMYKCSQETCGIWNHESCLLDDLLNRAWTAEQKGTLDKEMQEKGPFVNNATNTYTGKPDERSLGDVFFPVNKLGQMLKNQFKSSQATGSTPEPAPASTERSNITLQEDTSDASVLSIPHDSLTGPPPLSPPHPPSKKKRGRGRPPILKPESNGHKDTTSAAISSPYLSTGKSPWTGHMDAKISGKTSASQITDTVERIDDETESVTAILKHYLTPIIHHGRGRKPKNPVIPSSGDGAPEFKEWTVKLDCLKCGMSLD